MDFYSSIIEFVNIRTEGATPIQDSTVSYRSEEAGPNVVKLTLDSTLVKPPDVVHELRKRKVHYRHTQGRREIEWTIPYLQQITETGSGILHIGENMSMGYEILTSDNSSADNVQVLSVVNTNSLYKIKFFNFNEDCREVILSQKTSKQSGDVGCIALGLITKGPVITDDGPLIVESQNLGLKVFTTPHVIAWGFKVGRLTKPEAVKGFSQIAHHYQDAVFSYINTTFNDCIDKLDKI